MCGKRIDIVVFAATLFALVVARCPLEAADGNAEHGKNTLIVIGSAFHSVSVAHSIGGVSGGFFSLGYERGLGGRLSFRLSFDPGSRFFQNGDQISSTGFSVAIIRSVFSRKHYDVRAEVGAGMTISSIDFPVRDTHRLHFPLFIGCFAEFPLHESWVARVGVRFFHLSNANLGERNPGINGPMLVLGLGYCF
jgi:hypothetical protein